MNEAVKEKLESAEEGSIISDVAELKQLCDQTEQPPSTDPAVLKRIIVDIKADRPIAIAERHYAEIDKLYNEVAKPILDARREALAEIVELAGVGHTFQDADGIVYHLADKNGTFVEFTPYEIKRTQRVYGEGGSHIFARKTAEALGFENIFKPEKAEAAKE